MAITSTFDPTTGLLTTTGDDLANAITTSRNAAGTILINGGAVAVQGGTPTVANTALMQVFGQGDNDTITLDEANGALPSYTAATATTCSPAARAATSCSERPATTPSSAKAAPTFCVAATATTRSPAGTATTRCSARPATTA